MEKDCIHKAEHQQENAWRSSGDHLRNAGNNSRSRTGVKQRSTDEELDGKDTEKRGSNCMFHEEKTFTEIKHHFFLLEKNPSGSRLWLVWMSTDDSSVAGLTVVQPALRPLQPIVMFLLARRVNGDSHYSEKYLIIRDNRAPWIEPDELLLLCLSWICAISG